MSVLVTGASGLVGSHVVEALVARGEPVRALVRPASRAAVLRLGAEAVTGDVTDPAAWEAAGRGGRALGIGRGAGGGRVEISGGGVSFKKKKRDETVADRPY